MVVIYKQLKDSIFLSILYIDDLINRYDRKARTLVLAIYGKGIRKHIPLLITNF